jgi:N-acylneuraminate cytidylyltransferase
MVRVVAIIPARGGSKGLPGKNVRLLHGVPLIVHSIRSALSCAVVDRVVVSTDHARTAALALAAGAEVPFTRPVEISGDASTDFEVFEHAAIALGPDLDDVIVQLRPTSPLRAEGLIERCIHALRSDPNASSCRTVSSPPHPPFKMFYDTSPYLTPLFRRVGDVDEPYNAPRQSLPPVLEPNGCVDVLRVRTLREYRSMTGPSIAAVRMEHGNAVDIDSLEDFVAAERKLNESSKHAAA